MFVSTLDAEFWVESDSEIEEDISLGDATPLASKMNWWKSQLKFIILFDG